MAHKTAYSNLDENDSDYRREITGKGSSTYASYDSGTSSLTSEEGACAAYAGPNGANSTCANIEGKGVSTRAADDGANSANAK